MSDGGVFVRLSECFNRYNDGSRHHFTVLALTRKNSNAATVFVCLHKLVEVQRRRKRESTTRLMIFDPLIRQVFTEYFKELEEESIRDNFVIVYELLDEMIDFGHPQTTESKILKE